ncbi:MAG TPA: CCA tRNA nucleotidyltransferase [Gemmatimonadaceae bacterium]|nr:CCA tRNA nucleotidyltransferase [Gemmatimonadaceae bacterium]
MLEPPRVVLDIFDKLERAGYDTWCVGGAVRDALLGLPNADWDLATAATPQEVMRLFKHHVPLGVEHGTVGVLDRQRRVHEVTTFRTDVETDGRHAVVKFGASLDEDLARRDFTINAIAYKPRSGELRDPFNGRADLDRHLIRAVGSPPDRMREDRLRALRAIRFAARFEFDIDPATWNAIVASVPDLPRLSAERIAQELEKTMQQVRRPSLALSRWRDAGALRVLIPALADLEDTTIASLDCIPRRRWEYRLAALFLTAHGEITLSWSKQRSKWISGLSIAWTGLGSQIESDLQAGKPQPAQIRRWVSRIGRLNTDALFRIAAARWTATQKFPRETIRSLYGRAVRAAFRDPVEIGDLAIDGNDVIAAGFPPGPRIRQILESLLDLVLEDPKRNTREYLLRVLPRPTT